jgi:hypothetical protein
MPHMNLRTFTPFAVIAAVLLAVALASLTTGATLADPMPRAASGLALRAL